MNVGQGQAHESRFGPSSDVINVSDFLEVATNLEQDSEPCKIFVTSSTHAPGLGYESWNQLSEDERTAISAECGIDDLRSCLTDVLSNPRLMAHVTKTHDASVQAIYETADPSNRRKRKRATIAEPDPGHPEVVALKQKLDGVQLRSWPLSMSAASFIRPTRQSDYNTLIQIKHFSQGSSGGQTREALVFITVYSRLLWGHRLVARSSEHVFLSSQTLGDLFDVIPCSSQETPREHVDEDGEVVGYETANAESNAGGVICVEGLAYGDGLSEEDYSEKLLRAARGARDGAGEVPLLEKGPAMHDTKLSTLPLRLHEPYWLLHAGNCEHFLVIEQIRLHHPSDPSPAAFPLTTQVTPPLLDVCRACNKTPAVYAVNGDVRLGESPFVICGPCWRWMGEPTDAGGTRVVVVPLPKHEHAWSG